MSDCGAEVVYYAGQPYPNMQNLLDDAAQIGYDPIWLTDSNAYLQSFADWNATGGDNVYLRTAFTPFEQADSNPATQQYLDIVTEHGGDTSSASRPRRPSCCGPPRPRSAAPTWQCVLDELAKVTSWTGGGLHAESNPGGTCPRVRCSSSSTARPGCRPPEEEGEFDCNPDGASS